MRLLSNLGSKAHWFPRVQLGLSPPRPRPPVSSSVLLVRRGSNWNRSSLALANVKTIASASSRGQRDRLGSGNIVEFDTFRLIPSRGVTSGRQSILGALFGFLPEGSQRISSVMATSTSSKLACLGMGNGLLEPHLRRRLSTGGSTLAGVPKGSNNDPVVSTSSTNQGSSTSSSSENPPAPQLGRRERLKKAIQEYGLTVIVFHIVMSMGSLGLCYTLVSSGLDVVGLLSKIGVGEDILGSRLTQGASTFVVAYAVHKVFAPVRITITLTATPLIVRKLRAIGFLKKPPQVPPPPPSSTA